MRGDYDYGVTMERLTSDYRKTMTSDYREAMISDYGETDK